MTSHVPPQESTRVLTQRQSPCIHHYAHCVVRRVSRPPPRQHKNPNLRDIRSVIGPAIGGALARPCKFYPRFFPPGSIWDRFPYLLPNLFSAAAVCCGVLIGIFFLEETHPEKKKQRDRGVELGNRFLSHFSRRRAATGKAANDEEQALLGSPDEQLPGYRTTENSPQLASATGPELPDTLDLTAAAKPKRLLDLRAKPCSRTFTKPVVLNIISFGILAL